jgi:transcriptional regulator with XRE-family HTH domain
MGGTSFATFSTLVDAKTAARMTSPWLHRTAFQSLLLIYDSCPIRVVSMNSQCILFGGKHVNLSALGRTLGIHASHLSRIFSGKRNPSLRVARNISEALEMTLDAFERERKRPTDQQQLESLARGWKYYLGTLRTKQAELVEAGLPEPEANIQARAATESLKPWLGLV